MKQKFLSLGQNGMKGLRDPRLSTTFYAVSGSTEVLLGSKEPLKHGPLHPLVDDLHLFPGVSQQFQSTKGELCGPCQINQPRTKLRNHLGAPGIKAEEVSASHREGMKSVISS